MCHGQPMVRGLRYTVESLLELLSAGMSIDEVLEDYPDLVRDDLLVALELGALAAGRRRVAVLAEVAFVEIGPEALVLHRPREDGPDRSS